jgi:hypothetical protein
MSEKNVEIGNLSKYSLIDILIKLIFKLDEEGILSIEDLIKRLGFTATVGFIKKRKRFNYDEVAEKITKFDFVFLIVERRTASYAKHRLEAITYKKISATPARYRGEYGYLFGISEPEMRST